MLGRNILRNNLSIRTKPLFFTAARMSSTSLPTRQPSSEERVIIDEILSLYQCRPSEKSYSHYADTAVFHDPVSIAKGKESIMSQFNGMPKICEYLIG